MFCIKCGTVIPDDAKFCFKCGNEIKVTSDESNVSKEKYQTNSKTVQEVSINPTILPAAQNNHSNNTPNINDNKSSPNGCLILIIVVIVSFLIIWAIVYCSVNKPFSSNSSSPDTTNISTGDEVGSLTTKNDSSNNTTSSTTTGILNSIKTVKAWKPYVDSFGIDYNLEQVLSSYLTNLDWSNRSSNGYEYVEITGKTIFDYSELYYSFQVDQVDSTHCQIIIDEFKINGVSKIDDFYHYTYALFDAMRMGDEDVLKHLNYPLPNGFEWIDLPHYDNANNSIVGVVKNSSGKAENCCISFILFDNNGFQIGTCDDATNSLQNGREWKFKAYIFQNDVYSFEFNKCYCY